jgi:N-acetylglucosaminyl-diphospho-decaprenol L-rhamnosyltransferase
MTVRLAIIVLNYRTAKLTADCLRSMVHEIEPDMRVVVVDNASGDGSAEELEALIADQGWSGWATVVRSPHNGGFAAGNNLGIRSIDAAAYLLLNSDTLIHEGTFRGLLAAAERYPRAGIIGPSMQDENGNVGRSHFRFLGPWSELIRAANTGLVTRALHRFDPLFPITEEPLEPDWVGFACVLIRREVLQEVGLLDEGYFMYFEDVDYCRRAKQAGWSVLYWPATSIVHLLGKSSAVTSDEGRRRRAPRYYYEARARYLATYYGRIGLLLANFMWLAGRGVSLARELLGRPSALRKSEALDIWINIADPMQPPTGRRT